MITDQHLCAIREFQDDSIDMWVILTAKLADALLGTDLDPESATLLDDMIACRKDHAGIDAFLDCVPPLALGRIPAARDMLQYLQQGLKSLAAELPEEVTEPLRGAA